MQIKQHYLTQYIQKNDASIYWLLGQDNYLIDTSYNIIKSQATQHADIDEQYLLIQSNDDWKNLIEEANCYALFSEIRLLHVVYEKKTIDATVKKILSAYLKSINPKSILVIKAPNIPAKQLTWLANHNRVLLVLNYPLNADAMKKWIIDQFKIKQLSYTPDVPELIYQYTQGNMLACAQAIEKISLTYAPESHISKQQALEHLFNQCDHSLFDLVESCLRGQADKNIQILRQAAENKTEATLVLWILTQEVRTLLRLHDLIQQQVDYNTACTQLKIWPQRTQLYRMSLSRLSALTLQSLLHYALCIDAQIKSNLNSQVWNELEQFVLVFCDATRSYIST